MRVIKIFGVTVVFAFNVCFLFAVELSLICYSSIQLSLRRRYIQCYMTII